jgi:hypothetical protein
MPSEQSVRIPPDALLSGWALAAAVGALERIHGHHLASMTADEEQDARDHWRRQAQDTLSAVHAAVAGPRQPGAGAAVLSFADTDGGGLELGVHFDPALEHAPAGETIGTPAQGLAARVLAGLREDLERPHDENVRGVERGGGPPAGDVSILEEEAARAPADAGAGSANPSGGVRALHAGDIVAVGVEALERIHGHHLAAMTAELEREARGQWHRQAEEMLTAVLAVLTRERPVGVGLAVLAFVDAGGGRVDFRVDYEPPLEDTGSGEGAGTPAQSLAAKAFSALRAGGYSRSQVAPPVPDV